MEGILPFFLKKNKSTRAMLLNWSMTIKSSCLVFKKQIEDKDAAYAEDLNEQSENLNKLL